PIRHTPTAATLPSPPAPSAATTMRPAPSRASPSRLGPTTATAVVAIALRSGILCMGGVSFLAPRGRSRSLQPEGYAAFFMPPVHNLRVYLAILCGSVLEVLGFNLQLIHTIPGGLWEIFIGVWLIVRGFNSSTVAFY